MVTHWLGNLKIFLDFKLLKKCSSKFLEIYVSIRDRWPYVVAITANPNLAESGIP
jgi:hypothetical protein